MVSLNSLSSGSLKQIPHNFLASSSFCFSCDHFCLSFSLAFLAILVSSARGPCNFGPLADLAFSVSREVSINTVFTKNPHFSQALALKIIHERNWRVSLCVHELFHPQDFL